MSRASLARRSLIILAALILLFEEWIWNAMLRATARLVAHPWIQAAERRLAELEPVEALCAFVLPALIMLPFKFAAIYVLARGYFVTGTAVLVLAKVVSTTLGARIYVVVRPQLQQVGWYVRLESRFLAWKRRIVGRCAPPRPGRRCKPISPPGACDAMACCAEDGAAWWPRCACCAGTVPSTRHADPPLTKRAARQERLFLCQPGFRVDPKTRRLIAFQRLRAGGTSVQTPL